MIELVFTLDYEIFGNGTGALKDLVYEPAKRLENIFREWRAPFVAFVEVAELEKIEAYGTDSAIGLVKEQVRDFHKNDIEVALHLHPQWANAHYEEGRWSLDSSEYNLCTLPRRRIAQIVDRSLDYLRYLIDDGGFIPLSFRAGNWLFQPTRTVANVLAEKGIKIDSSVFKGGLQHNHSLDYRHALKNGYYWPFSHNVNEPDPMGSLIEVPIYTNMVPSWKMLTSKRMAFSNQLGMAGRNARQTLARVVDFLRFRYPLKLDFSRMTLTELTSMLGAVIQEDRMDPASYRPIVAIGHTKDLTDFDTIDSFLSFLRMNRIKVSTFADIYPKLAKAGSLDHIEMPTCH